MLAGSINTQSNGGTFLLKINRSKIGLIGNEKSESSLFRKVLPSSINKIFELATLPQYGV
ncbi:hypothetical protein D3C76_1814650 [compost metagenome]